jgi:hypothetical protein
VFFRLWIDVPAPSLLPILRSQQGEILALVLGDPDRELSPTLISDLTGVPHPSVYREVQRAELAGPVTSRRVGNTGSCESALPAPATPGWPTC